MSGPHSLSILQALLIDVIEVKDISKSFREVKAVKGLSFVAPDGHITGLLGPNGAGKTTTMRMISGIVQPDEGAVLIDGLQVRPGANEALARLGVLPDGRGLYPRLSARENIRYFGRLYGYSGEELEERIETLAIALGMGSILDRRVQGFSQGERMKVALARAVVHDPQNIMLDEPTNGLDVMSTRSMRSVIQDFRERGRCVVFSSHIMQEVGQLCDTIVVMAAGKIVAQGTAEELCEQAKQSNLEDVFVALIGSGEGLWA